MESIEERANKFKKNNPFLVNMKGGWVNDVLVAFAKEQQKIDIEKACQICHEQLKGLLGDTKEAKRLAYEDFKQTMEE